MFYEESFTHLTHIHVDKYDIVYAGIRTYEYMCTSLRVQISSATSSVTQNLWNNVMRNNSLSP